MWCLLSIILTGLTAGVAPPVAATERQPQLAAIERYLNSIKTLRSVFIQSATNGQVSQGQIYLSRPGRLRIDYKPPVQLQIFGDTTWLTFIDSELKEVNQLPVNASPAALLLSNELRLSTDVGVEKIKRRDEELRVYLYQKKQPDAGRLILALATKPFRLMGWSVVDAQGITTTVTLIGPKFNMPINNRIFDFNHPDWTDPTTE